MNVILNRKRKAAENKVKDFNRHSVYSFYDLLNKIVDENGLTATKICNVDER